MAVDKSTWNKKVKVSQSTIDDIKKLGMDKALKMAKMNAKSPQAGLVAEYQEATRRLYGDKRFSAATGASAKKPSTSYSPTKMTPTTKAVIKKQSSMKNPPAKKSGGVNKAAAVAGGVLAAGALLATRGRAAGIATKLAPGMMSNKFAQAALTGKVAQKGSTVAMKAKDAAAATTGRMAAAAKRPVSQTQYDAMVSAARIKGTKAVAKKAAPAAKKAAPAKKVISKLAEGKRFDANAPKVTPPKK